MTRNPKLTFDPVEQIVRQGLIDSGVRFIEECNETHQLDFGLPDHGLLIEVKQFHSDRISEQMSRSPNVIAVQGRQAAEFFASALMALGSTKHTNGDPT